MADEPGPLASLTLQDQKLVMSALKSLKFGLEVDYSTLAQHMGWHIKDDPTKPNARKANNAWLATRKKVFPDGPPAAIATVPTINTKSPATPRKKDVDAQKTASNKKSPAKSALEKPKGNEEEVIAAPEKTVNGVTDDTAARQSAGNMQKVTADAEGDMVMRDSNAAETGQQVNTAPVTGTSVVDEMSAGSMSPIPASKNGTQAPVTPSRKATAKTPKIVNDESASGVVAPDTPTPAPKATPQKRKTIVEKELERVQDADDDGVDKNAEGSPAAKKHKSGTAATKNISSSGSVDRQDDGDEPAKPTPVKTPRKPSAAVLAKREAREQERATKKAEKEQEKAEKEQEKADKKAAKEKEKADKQAANKRSKKNTEYSEPKTPDKPAPTPPAENVEEEDAEEDVGEENAGEVNDQEAKDKAAVQAQAALAIHADQGEIKKRADDDLDVAHIDRPASSLIPTEHSPPDVPAATDKAEVATMMDKFIPVGGHKVPAEPTSGLETVMTTSETDGDTINVGEQGTNAVEERSQDDAISVGPVT